MNIKIYKKNDIICLAGEVFGKNFNEATVNPDNYMRTITVSPMGPFFQVVFRQSRNVIEFDNMAAVHNFLQSNNFTELRR